MIVRIVESLTVKVDAYRLFFPVVAVYGMLVVPLSTLSLKMGIQVLPGVATPLGHAHEMLFGYVLGVATGYLLNRVPLWWVIGLATLWLLARAFYLMWPEALVTNIVNIGFAFVFSASTASRFIPRAKKWRNTAFGGVLLSLGIALAAAQLAAGRLTLPVTYFAIYVGVLMVALLMLLLGGRFIAPAVAGHIERQGGELDARVQPVAEGGIIISLVSASVAFLLFESKVIAGALLALCGGISLV